MRVEVIAVGKGAERFVEEGCRNYRQRLDALCRFRMELIPPVKGGNGLSPVEVMEQEAVLIAQRLHPQSHVFLLDEQGVEYTSQELAARIEGLGVKGISHLTFVIGGAWGLSSGLKQRYPQHLSLSRFTLPHGLARLLLVEQLYRALSIIRGLPYHHA